MAKIPDPIHTTTALIYTAYENDAEDGNRPHLGASLIGHQCERYLWNVFRWVDTKKFPGRLLRLFETGQLEEQRVARNLRRIGVDLHTETPDGKQWRVSDFGGHFGGSLDPKHVAWIVSGMLNICCFLRINHKVHGDISLDNYFVHPG